MWLYVACLLPVLWYAYFRLRYWHKFRLAANFPGPAVFPFIGSIWRFMNIPPEDLVPTVEQLYRDHGGIFRVWVGMHKVAFIVCEARYAEIVLSHSHKYLAKSDIYSFLVDWLGDGLLLSTDQKWRNRRKAITPAFHFKILEQFEEVFAEQGQVLIDRLRPLAQSGEVIDVYEYISLMALDCICEAAMGTQINAQLDAKSDYVQAVHDMSQAISIRISKVWTRSSFLLWLFANDLKRRQDRAIRVLHEFSQNVIRKRRQQLVDNSNASADVADEFGVKAKYALLDILLRSTIDGQSLSDRDIQEEVDTFMFEGHDTSTSAMCFTLHLLSRHKEVQDKLYAEVRANGNGKGKMHNLKYMELVIKESMRLYPPVSFIGRNLEEDTRIDADHVIPARSNFSINLLVMFRDPNVFERPLDFWPERFELHKDRLDAAGAYAYCPFSAGTRNCIGQKFAMLEMKSTLAKVLAHYELLPGGPDLVVVNELILRSTTGMQMRLAPRRDRAEQ